MQALFILGCWVSLITLGCVAPFVMALAYIWVDLFRPQDVAPVLGQLLPFSATTAMLTIGAYLVLDRRDPPRLGLLTALLVLWAGWITLTTSWAMFPTSAWWKWDWAFKTILFTALLPFIFRSRIQMEAALLVILCCIASNVLPFAIQSVFGGGGYGRPFGLIEINGGWAGRAALSAPMPSPACRWSPICSAIPCWRRPGAGCAGSIWRRRASRPSAPSAPSRGRR